MMKEERRKDTFRYHLNVVAYVVSDAAVFKL